MAVNPWTHRSLVFFQDFDQSCILLSQVAEWRLAADLVGTWKSWGIGRCCLAAAPGEGSAVGCLMGVA